MSCNMCGGAAGEVYEARRLFERIPGYVSCASGYHTCEKRGVPVGQWCLACKTTKDIKRWMEGTVWADTKNWDPVDD